MQDITASRKEIVDFYNQKLDFSKLRKIKIRESTQWNCSYYPVIFETEELLLKVQKALNDQNIFPRRYFYPSLNTLNYVKGSSMPVSESIASRVLCLPLSSDFNPSELEKIVAIINNPLC